MFDITKIELEDFRSFRGKHGFEFHTEPGLYAITGKNLENPRLGANGSGKTTSRITHPGTAWTHHTRPQS